jgi:hypothetical protein
MIDIMTGNRSYSDVPRNGADTIKTEGGSGKTSEEAPTYMTMKEEMNERKKMEGLRLQNWSDKLHVNVQ